MKCGRKDEPRRKIWHLLVRNCTNVIILGFHLAKINFQPARFLAPIQILTFKSFIFENIIFSLQSNSFITYKALCKISHLLDMGQDICTNDFSFEIVNLEITGQFLTHLKVSIVALIPARSGSKRIVDKNIKLLNGHPLIAYTITAAIDSGVFGEIIVSTDSEKYKEISEYYGASVSFRPEKFAGDNSPDIEWVTYTLNELMNEERKFDYFSILRPTSPFRTPKTIII